MKQTGHRSEELSARARQVIPGGMYGHQSVSLLPDSFPQFFARAKGARLWDVEGREYVDFLCGYGPNLFGFFDVSNDPYITQSAYWIANARVAYQFESDRYEVAAFVRNLANKQYYVDKFDLTAPFGFIEGIVGTPRFFGIEFNGHF